MAMSREKTRQHMQTALGALGHTFPLISSSSSVAMDNAHQVLRDIFGFSSFRLSQEAVRVFCLWRAIKLTINFDL